MAAQDVDTDNASLLPEPHREVWWHMIQMGYDNEDFLRRLIPFCGSDVNDAINIYDKLQEHETDKLARRSRKLAVKFGLPKDYASVGFDFAEIPSGITSEVAKLLTCVICFMPLRDPVAPRCDHVFCSKCLSKASEARSECPICAGPLRPTHSSRLAKDLLELLPVRCPNDGCSAEDTYARMTEVHLPRCPKQQGHCGVCGTSTTFESFENHLSGCIAMPSPYNLVYVFEDAAKPPMRMTIHLPRTATILQYKQAVSDLVGVPVFRLKVYEVYGSHFYTRFEDADEVSVISEMDFIYVFELPAIISGA